MAKQTRRGRGTGEGQGPAGCLGATAKCQGSATPSATADLDSLRELVLIAFGMDLESLGCLTHLQKLERLTWVVPTRFCVCGNGFDHTVANEERVQEAEDFVFRHADAALVKVFDDFTKPPEIYLLYSDSYNNQFSRKEWRVAKSRWPLRRVSMYDDE